MYAALNLIKLSSPQAQHRNNPGTTLPSFARGQCYTSVSGFIS
jgi:hypothetical protein